MWLFLARISVIHGPSAYYPRLQLWKMMLEARLEPSCSCWTSLNPHKNQLQRQHKGSLSASSVVFRDPKSNLQKVVVVLGTSYS